MGVAILFAIPVQVTQGMVCKNQVKHGKVTHLFQHISTTSGCQQCGELEQRSVEDH